jgi:hypothetical protein
LTLNSIQGKFRITENEQGGEKAVVFNKDICYNWEKIDKGKLRPTNHEA